MKNFRKIFIYRAGHVVRLRYDETILRFDTANSTMSDSRLSLAALGALDQPAFTAYLAGIYEHSPWIPERSWALRPFPNRQSLLQALEQTLDAASHEEKLRLVLAHPELAGKAAVSGRLTDDSQREQTGAGLDQCSPEEFETIQHLNREYGNKFGFPFIVAVKGLSRQDIIAVMARRIERSSSEEFAEALEQIKRIASFRIAGKVSD